MREVVRGMRDVARRIFFELILTLSKSKDEQGSA